eukprot:gene352-376_t
MMDDKKKRRNEIEDPNSRKRIYSPSLVPNQNEIMLFQDDDGDSSGAEFFDEVDHHPHTHPHLPHGAPLTAFPASLPAIPTSLEYLNVDGQVWEEAMHGITVDHSSHCTVHTELLWSDEDKFKIETGRMKELDYFNFMFPTDCIPSILDATNINLASQNLPPVSRGELYRMFGIRLAMALDLKMGVVNGDFWNSVQELGTIFRSPRYGERFGMLKSRWEQLNSLWSLEQGPPSHIAPQGTLHGVLSFIQAFNNRREHCIRPGSILCISESFTNWSGWQRETLQSWIYPQPSNWASQLDFFKDTQLKCCVDATTGIMLRLEFIESEHVMNQKPYRTAPHNYSPATALVMRLTEPWHQKEPRVVTVNRAFSSVECLQACEAVGLKYLGGVKKHSLKFPATYLEKYRDQLGKESRGSIKVLSSSYRLPGDSEEYANRPMHVVWWKGKRSIALLANCSTTEPVHLTMPMNGYGDVSTLPYPKCLDIYFKGVTAVNVHDYYREGRLGIENSFKAAQNGWQQIFASVWGMIIVDAFFAYRSATMDFHHHDPEHVAQELLAFCGRLAHQMIHNSYDADHVAAIPLVSTAFIPSSSSSDCDEHRLVSVQVAIQQLDREHTHKDWQLKCKICGGKTRKFCLKCSNIETKKLFGICSDSTAKMKPCFALHKASS